jgi:hypothetical protein
MWGALAGDQQTLNANGPGDFQLTANIGPAGYTGVQVYPDIQQLTNNWCGTGFGGCANPTDTPLSALTSLTSSYAETMPHNTQTISQAAWDIWLDNTSFSEVMVWVDNVNRGNGGATYKDTTTINGQQWTLYMYGSEIIWSLGAPGTYANQTSGTVDLLALLNWLVAHGYEPSGIDIAQIDFGWEICSTGAQNETFGVSSYTLNAH